MKIKLGMEAEYTTYVENSSKGGYSKGVIDFTERWAALMEARLDQGENLADIARQTSNEADTEGITGFMYGCAVQALAHFWEYGGQLRRWHNLDCQIGNEGERANESGGILNPAIITIKG